MKKILIVVVIVLTVFIIGAFIYIRYFNLPDAPQPRVNGPAELGLDLPEQNSQAEDLLTAEKEGIQVTVDEVKRENNQTIIKLTMDNHVYNLGEFDLKNLSSLNGIKPSAYQILGDQSGGHHLEADIVFPGELSGKLMVGMKDDLVFEFNL